MTMKRKLPVMLILLFIIVVGYACASTPDEGVCGDELTWKLDGDGLLTISGAGDMYDYDFDYPWDGEEIESIVVEEGVTRIGDCAFSMCAPVSVKLPSTLFEIGARAFSLCSALKTVDLGGVQKIGEMAFFYCEGLSGVEFPDSVFEIGQSAFQGCTKLKTVYIGAGLATMGEDAFAECETMTSFETDAANTHFKAIDGILYDETGETLFFCPWGKSGVLTLPDGLRVIRDRAFWGCTGLSRIETPDSLAEIGDETFMGCLNLVGISIGSGVRHIGADAFTPLWNLGKIVVSEDNAYYASAEGLLYDADFENLLCCPQARSGRADIADGVREIDDRVFTGCGGITELSIPASVTYIADRAFADTVLQMVYLYPYSYAEKYCRQNGIPFEYAYSVSFLPKNLRSIEAEALENIVAETIILPQGLETIGARAFAGSKARLIDIPDSVTKIEDDAFAGCDELTLYVAGGSYAEEYAKEKGIPYALR